MGGGGLWRGRGWVLMVPEPPQILLKYPPLNAPCPGRVDHSPPSNLHNLVGEVVMQLHFLIATH